MRFLSYVARSIKTRAICRTLSNAQHDFLVESVRNADQLRQACRLLYREYQRRGYCEPNENRIHSSPFMFGEHSRTFVLEESNCVLGTISIFPDSNFGVPLESLYSDEITILRERGIRFAEVGLLATDPAIRKMDASDLGASVRMLPLFLLFKIVVNYAISSDIGHLLIVVHPKHRRLYEFFGFRQFAEVKSYQTVCGNPALPMIQNLREEARQAAPSLRKLFLASPFASQNFSKSFTSVPASFADAYDSFQGTE